MANQVAIINHLRRLFPQPAPDPQWVSECVAALLADGQAATPESVEEQYLYADLGASTRHSPVSGIPIPQNDESAELHNKTLFPVPTLVQIHSVAEIGASAFALNTTLEQRRDIISGATRIRRLEDEEDEQQAEKGPPPYPRSMLVMDVSDGRTALRAIEYRRITGLTLGATPLGTKLLVHKVRCLRGTLLLAPDNCTVLGGAVDALEANQPAAFVEGLNSRLEAAKNGSAGGALPPPTRRRTLPVSRRGGAGANAAASSSRAPAAARGTSSAPVRPSSSDAARAARLAAIQAAAAQPAPPPPTRPRAPPPQDTTFDDDDFDDSFFEHIASIEAQAVHTQPGRPGARTAKRRREEVDVIVVSD